MSPLPCSGPSWGPGKATSRFSEHPAFCWVEGAGLRGSLTSCEASRLSPGLSSSPSCWRRSLQFCFYRLAFALWVCAHITSYAHQQLIVFFTSEEFWFSPHSTPTHKSCLIQKRNQTLGTEAATCVRQEKATGRRAGLGRGSGRSRPPRRGSLLCPGTGRRMETHLSPHGRHAVAITLSLVEKKHGLTRKNGNGTKSDV